MDKEIKQLWINKLRSGEYEQGGGQLVIGEGEKEKYCCIGVLCEVLVDKGVLEKEYELNRPVDGGQTLVFSLTSPRREELGISDEQEGALIQMNDSDGKDFHEIADYIETNL
jgi:hypothetical protein